MKDMPLLKRPGTVFCILCQGIVTYKEGDTKRFDDHMNIEHGAYHNLRYILAGCLMNVEERIIVAEIIEERQKADGGSIGGHKDETDEGKLSILDKAFPLVKDWQDNFSKSEWIINDEEAGVKINCSLCESTFANHSNLNRHLRRFHKLSKEERGLVQESRMSTGARNEHADSSIYVENTGNNKEHKERMEENIDTSVKISKNNEVQESNIDQEIEGSKSCQCPLCGSAFTRVTNLKRHILNQHAEKRINGDFNCLYCDYGCTEEKSLLIHKGIKHKDKLNEQQYVPRVPTEENMFMNCTLCDYSCNLGVSLKIHMGKKHKGLKTEEHDLTIDSKVSPRKRSQTSLLNCNLCDYSSTKESSLKIHKTMKHKANEKFEEKLLISQSLFKKKHSLADENKKYDCNKCDYTGIGEKDLRYHRFKNHRHALMKKQVKLETDNDLLLVEDALNISEVSLDLDDTLSVGESVVDENESSMNESSRNIKKKVLSKEQYRIFNEKKAEVVDKSEYFKSFPDNLLAWNGREEDLALLESYPRGFGVKNSVSRGGRKYGEYATPDRVFKLRSLIAVLEFMKVCGEYSEEEIQSFERKVKSKCV